MGADIQFTAKFSVNEANTIVDALRGLRYSQVDFVREMSESAKDGKGEFTKSMQIAGQRILTCEALLRRFGAEIEEDA